MLTGGTIQESIQLNIESLWSGGPFQDPVCNHPTCVRITYSHQTYNGGNSLPSQRTKLAGEMKKIREAIFASPGGTIDSKSSFVLGTGKYKPPYKDISEIMAPAGAYGVWIKIRTRSRCST